MHCSLILVAAGFTICHVWQCATVLWSHTPHLTGTDRRQKYTVNWEDERKQKEKDEEDKVGRNKSEKLTGGRWRYHVAKESSVRFPSPLQLIPGRVKSTLSFWVAVAFLSHFPFPHSPPLLKGPPQPIPTPGPFSSSGGCSVFLAEV